MVKDMADQRMQTDEFLVQHLVDPSDWVSDSERSLCNVCTRQFSTFRRKHHCRMCGEIVCSNCTLLKSALLPTIGFTRVRVCVSCVFKHARRTAPFSPRSEDTLSMSLPTEESREWLNSHLHSPVSKSDEGDYDTEEYGSSDSFESNNNSSGSGGGGGDDNQQQHSPQYKSPIKRGDNNGPAHQYEFPNLPAGAGYRKQPTRGNNQQEASAAATPPPPRSEVRGAAPSSPPSSSTTWSHPWPKPPVGPNEASRLEALRALGVLDSAPEKPYDMICDLAKARLSCPMAAVSFMDEHRQWFKASAGLAHKMIPRKIAFCAYTVCSKEPVVVLDTLKDKRFESNPLVSGAAAVRFYAAAPILDPTTGHAVGSVFVLDTRPRESCDVTILERLAHAASDNLPLRSDAVPMERQLYVKPEPLSPAPSTASTSSLSSQPSLSSASSSPTGNNNSNNNSSDSDSSSVAATKSAPSSSAGVQLLPPPSVATTAAAAAPAAVMPMSPLSTMLTTTTTAAMTAGGSGVSAATVASGEQMEMLLMQLLTKNTETQQQLASQQMSISNTIGYHSTQISKLMSDFARMEAKIEAKIK